MATFHGDCTAGRDFIVLEGDYKPYKPLDQCTPQELIQDRPNWVNRYLKRQKQRRQRALPWMLLPIGFTVSAITLLFFAYQDIAPHGFSFRVIFYFIIEWTKPHPPIFYVAAFGFVFFALFAIPMQRIKVLFREDEFMQRQRAVIHEIDMLIDERE